MIPLVPQLFDTPLLCGLTSGQPLIINYKVAGGVHARRGDCGHGHVAGIPCGTCCLSARTVKCLPSGTCVHSFQSGKGHATGENKDWCNINFSLYFGSSADTLIKEA